MMETLNVYLNGIPTGVLAQADSGLTFSYLPEYLRNRDARALSNVFPLSDAVYSGSKTEAFFSNLLPDERIRQTLAQILKLSPENTFGLLRELGEDCAGAIALYRPGRDLETRSKPEYLPLSEKQTSRILRRLDVQPLNVSEENTDFRLSGAGAQNKLIACVFDGRVSLPLHGTPSTHIIKPGIPAYPYSVFNEFFCMKLAKKCGLSAAECEILRFDSVPYYVTTRYDREIRDGVWTRIHQEDFCQAIGTAPEKKYENEGGPGLVECANKILEMRLRSSDYIAFIRLAVFNFIIGNGDAHAKNYSILYRDNGAQLAPAYDLISTAVYPSLSKKMAMKIGEDYSFARITRGKFTRFGERLGKGRQELVLNCLDEALDTVEPCAQQLAEELSQTEPSPIYQAILDGIRRRTNKLRR